MAHPIDTTLFDDLAVACDYPRGETAARVSRAAEALSHSGLADGATTLGSALRELASWLGEAASGEPEERYTQLFDLKPVCTLNLGHHIFGDTYQRGAMLAGLAAELNLLGIEHQHDLPDFLPTLLKLLGRLSDAESRVLLAHVIVLPALDKVAAKLEPSPGPWPALLRALPAFIAAAIPREDSMIPVPGLEVLQCSM